MFMLVLGFFLMYVSYYVDLVFGFVFGWNYWFNWVVMFVVEIVVFVIIMKFWFFDVLSIIWSVLFLGLIFLFNFLFVKSYGEFEYWFVFVKVVIIIVFIGVGFLMIFGIFGGEYIGFKNFILEEVLVNGGFLFVLSIFFIVGFFF